MTVLEEAKGSACPSDVAEIKLVWLNNYHFYVERLSADIYIS